MIDMKPSIVMEDSKDNMYFLYYKDSSIYFREVLNSGDSKDTVLISQANSDFAATIDSDDTVYLTCNSRYKGVLLFIYTNHGWKFESVVNPHNSSNIYIMDMLVLNGSIHIFFSKKLPVSNMYNVYHIHKIINEKAPFADYTWRKNSLSEIYSQNIESSYSILPVKGSIHYASVWYDGTHYYINYYCYDDSSKSWIHKSLSSSYKNQIYIKLLQHNKKINLLCFLDANGAGNIFHFLSKSSGSNEIDFKEHNNAHIDTKGAAPLFYLDDKVLQMAWVKDNSFYQYTYDDSSGKWRKAINLPITPDLNLSAFKYIRSSSTPTVTKEYFVLDKNFHISKPMDNIAAKHIEEKSSEKSKASAPHDLNEYLEQLLTEIKNLSDNVRYLHDRIDILENKEVKNPISPISNFNDHNKIEFPELKKSNFKENFLKGVKAPNFESLSAKQDNISTYLGKPESYTSPDNKPEETEE